MFRDKDFWKKLLAIMLPVAFQNLMLAAVSAGDAAMLGFVDENAMSAVSLAGNIQFLQNQILFALTSSAAIMISQYWGKQDKFAIGKIFGLILRYAVGASLLYTVVAMLAPDVLIRIYTDEPVLQELGAEYIRMAALSYFLTGITQCWLCVMRTTGQVRRSVFIGTTALVLDTVLNAVFIFGFRMGVKGAALTTVISRLVELAMIFFYHRKMEVKPSLWKFPKSLHLDLLKYGAPILLNSLVWGTGFSLFSVIIGHLGSAITAAYAIVAIVRELAASLVSGLGSGASILLANALGAGDMEKAKEYGSRMSKLSILCGIICAGLALLFGFGLSAVMTLSDEVRSLLNGMIWIRAFGVATLSINMVVICSVFASGGDTAFDAYSVAVTMWLIILPLAAMAAFWWKWDPIWVFFILSMDEAVKIPWVYVHYKKYKWLKNLTRDDLQAENA